MKFLILSILAFCMLCAGEKKMHPIRIGGMLFRNMEIAKTENDRIKGLMFRKELPFDGGMLFIFDKEEILSFWMRNTLIPLDIIFVDKNGTVTAVHTMKVEAPQGKNESDAAYCARLPGYSSIKPAIAAIEVNAGMASTIKPGDKIEIAELTK